MSNVLPRIAPPDCLICEGPCQVEFHRGDYVFPNRRPDPPPPVIEAPRHVYVNERLAYAEGDPIPWAEAVALGLVTGDPPPEPSKPKRGKRKARKRARRPAEDRARRPSEDR